jgi:hypothetical protein
MTNPYATAITIITIAVANTITTLQPTATPQNSHNHVAARAPKCIGFEFQNFSTFHLYAIFVARASCHKSRSSGVRSLPNSISYLVA